MPPLPSKCSLLKKKGRVTTTTKTTPKPKSYLTCKAKKWWTVPLQFLYSACGLMDLWWQWEKQLIFIYVGYLGYYNFILQIIRSTPSSCVWSYAVIPKFPNAGPIEHIQQPTLISKLPITWLPNSLAVCMKTQLRSEYALLPEQMVYLKNKRPILLLVKPWLKTPFNFQYSKRS